MEEVIYMKTIQKHIGAYDGAFGSSLHSVRESGLGFALRLMVYTDVYLSLLKTSFVGEAHALSDFEFAKYL